jgi:uncharacterized protein
VISTSQHNIQAYGRPGLLLDILFLLVALGLYLLLPSYGSLQGDFSITFLAILFEALPFMLLGSLAGGLIEVFMPSQVMDRWLGGRNYLAVLLGAGLGAVFPVCECAIIPVVRRLLRKRVPFSAAIAYLLGGPIVNPVVAASTAVAYSNDWVIVGARIGFGYLIATIVAFLMGHIYRNKPAIKPLGFQMATDPVYRCGSIGIYLSSRLLHTLHHAADDFFEVGKFLVIGSFIAALLRSMVPISVFDTMIASPWLAILLMMILAVSLNLCSEADAFIAASFSTVLPGSAQLAFMVLGPMLDIKLLLMYLPVFKKRVIITLALLTSSTVALAMLFLEYFLGGIG